MKYFTALLSVSLIAYSSYLFAHTKHDEDFEKEYEYRSRTEIGISSLSPDAVFLAYTEIKKKGLHLKNVSGDSLYDHIFYEDFYINPKIYWSDNGRLVSFVIDNEHVKPSIVIINNSGNELFRQEISDGAIDFGWVNINGNYGLFLNESKNIIFNDSSSRKKQLRVSSDNKGYSFKYNGHNDSITFFKDGAKIRSVNGMIYDLLPSPSGNYMVYGNAGDIYRYSYEDDSLLNIGYGTHVSWSPDENKIAYQKTEDNGHFFTNSDVYMYEFKEKKETKITDTKEKMESSPKWKDNHTIYFSFKNSPSVKFVNIEE